MKIQLAAVLAGFAVCAIATSANAQNAADVVQRDVNQQKRIEQGLQSGQLNTKEAGKLEREESGDGRVLSVSRRSRDEYDK